MTEDRGEQAVPSEDELDEDGPVNLVVITGHSGAGKSEAIAAFEDNGYFCVDNLPPQMIGALGEMFRLPGSSVKRAAVVSDVRSGEYFDELLEVLDNLETEGLKVSVLFLEANEEILMDRYKETGAGTPSPRKAASSMASGPSVRCSRRSGPGQIS